MLTRNKNIKLILNYVIGPLVFCLVAWSIWTQVRQQADWQHSIGQIADAAMGKGAVTIAAVVMLMIVNWGIEARKWQIALQADHGISFLRSLRAIYSGTALAFFTPNRMGEYFGRILLVPPRNRVTAIGPTVVCSMAQLIITLAAGAAGLVAVRSRLGRLGLSARFGMDLLTCLVVAALLVLTIFYFRVSWMLRSLEKLPKLQKYLTYTRAIERFNATVLVRILSLSAIRYAVFIVQYYLLFRVFDVGLNGWQSFWSMSVVFLVIAIIPNVAALSELGIRWGASVEVVRLFSPNTAGILASSLAVWMINLVAPALIGSVVIAGLKFFRR